MYKYLFSPITINKTEIKNRIAYPALGLLYSYDQKLNDRYYNYFESIARGGTGLVTVGPVGIDFVGSGVVVLSLSKKEAIPSFEKVTSKIKAKGARAWIQLFHAGAYSHPILIDGQQPISSSPIYSNYSKTTPREMSLADIEKVQAAYVQTALNAVEAGFDGIEILGSGGYLMTQFLSPLRNKRTDDYGGSFENRVRFPREVIEKIRAAVGPDVPLTIRISGNDFMAGGNTDLDTPPIVKVYETAGIDAINVTGGWHETQIPQLPMELPRTAYGYLALNVKKAVNVPVFASNRIADPDSAEKIIRDGFADMVNLGRVLIADPEWPQKAFNGRADEIRPCVACSQGCTDRVFSGMPVCCVGNPQAGFEKERQIIKTNHPKHVMVVGAGVAGLEASVTAAKAGHKVEVYDKDSDIGGQIWIAGAPPHKKELWEFVRYYRAMINKYNIRLHLNRKVDLDLIRQIDPDHVIVAEGARDLIPPIDGADDPSVISAWDLLKNNPPLGKNVAIIGGGAVGLETAMFVAAKGTITPEILYFLFTHEAASVERLRELMFRGSSTVTVFEMLPKAGKDVGKSTKWILMANLKRYGVTITTHAKVLSIKDGTVTYESTDKTVEANFDNVILASGSRSVQTLSREISALEIPFTTVGDCIKPGKLDDAIHGGFLAALNLGR